MISSHRYSGYSVFRVTTASPAAPPTLPIDRTLLLGYINIWGFRLDDAFEVELAFEREVQTELLAIAKLLGDYGPQLGRPLVDTLKGSRHANMKEMRFRASDGEWRAAVAFDPERKTILLMAGDKSGGSQKRFHNQLIAKANLRFSVHLENLKAAKKGM